MNSHYSSTLTGWREWVSLPDVGVPWIKAKIDTGAQTSALHADDIVEFENDGVAWVRFTVHPWQVGTGDAVTVELPIHDRRTVRSSSGHTQDRLVVMMNLMLVGREIPVEVTLTDRDEMVFRMLIGREALQQGYVVDSGASYLGGRPAASIRRRNQGK
ncbi:ATP-dependent zinc protease [Leucobacter denitrificans]|uniref:ATP-dependent zinc protease n=1 Tax=Leucobacter denitrificans TaxID=683042 RepID=A0A7G9S1Y8_9MICO|nr:RimK/LysX family protein [Leucobacter denitrificans]QNN61863.1 ATP-dependent zinc protease [Leucobacter denitrificans]